MFAVAQLMFLLSSRRRCHIVPQSTQKQSELEHSTTVAQEDVLEREMDFYCPASSRTQTHPHAGQSMVSSNTWSLIKQQVDCDWTKHSVQAQQLVFVLQLSGVLEPTDGDLDLRDLD